MAKRSCGMLAAVGMVVFVLGYASLANAYTMQVGAYAGFTESASLRGNFSMYGQGIHMNTAGNNVRWTVVPTTYQETSGTFSIIPYGYDYGSDLTQTASAITCVGSVLSANATYANNTGNLRQHWVPWDNSASWGSFSLSNGNAGTVAVTSSLNGLKVDCWFSDTSSVLTNIVFSH